MSRFIRHPTTILHRAAAGKTPNALASTALSASSPATTSTPTAAAAAATAATTISPSRVGKASSHVTRRWKSLLHYSQKQRPLSSLSQSGALNARSSFRPGTVAAAAGASCASSSSSSRSFLSPLPSTTAKATATAPTTISLTISASQLQTATLSSRRLFSTSVKLSPTMAAAKSESAASAKCLQLDNINPNFISMEYAVRGPLVIRAGEIENELKQGVKKPFDQVIRANIGDCHAMGQKPISFVRQLLALTLEPKLLHSPDYAEDVKKRACAILDGCQGRSVGSYTDSSGLEVIRRQVAEYIQRRDGIPSEWQHIILTAGATPGIKSILALIKCKVEGKRSGVMVPTPQYPLYSATLAEYGLEKIDYYLEEETNWGLSRAELQRSYDESKKRCAPRALVIINPGNPTGQVLKRDNIVEIIKFAHENKLLLLADEVYQDNIYAKGSEFHSFKKVMTEMGAPYKDMELVSFMSTSKGYLGECGIRGGYMEILNMCPKVLAMLSKSITASLCSTTAGQVAVSALVNPPQPGEPSYQSFITEKTNTLHSLKQRSELVYNTLSKFEGFKVNVIQGAMYVFPQIAIPPKAIEAAKAKNMPPDTFYAFDLLESTGICIIPGSGFGQKPGTYHFRTTILPPTEKLKVMMNKFQEFHADFMRRYK